MFLFASACSAEVKPDYQNAVLRSFRTIPSGQNCSAGTNGEISRNGDYSSHTNVNCSDTTKALYTIVFAGQVMVVEPSHSGKSKAGNIVSLGYSSLFWKNNCLYGQLPGTHLLLRSSGDQYQIRVGKKESLFRLVSAE